MPRFDLTTGNRRSNSQKTDIIMFRVITLCAVPSDLIATPRNLVVQSRPVIPAPQEVSLTHGIQFGMDLNTTIGCSGLTEILGRHLAEKLGGISGFTPGVVMRNMQKPLPHRGVLSA